MKKQQSSSYLGIIILIVILLLGGLAAYSAHKADWLGRLKSRPSYDEKLVSMVSVHGAFKIEDLNLSGSEIRKLNFAVLSHRETFPQVDLTLNPVTKRMPETMERATPLSCQLVFKTRSEAEIRFWKRTVLRRDFVPSVINSMRRAEKEYLHIRELPRARPLKRLYL